ncbi:MAG: hypothetical protein KF753_07350 [Caldilineaceae bacterium]|nr:hypothetical protein [Caldilineaceae bacterium]
MGPSRAKWEALPLIKVVGVSASGKSTLVARLREVGYNARPASQEHSETPDMWRRIRPPALLIYLEIDLITQRERRADVSWDPAWLATETARLAHARQHADLILNTQGMEAAQVFTQVLTWLAARKIARADAALPPVPRTGSAAR